MNPYTMDSFSEVPIKDLSERVLGEMAEEIQRNKMFERKKVLRTPQKTLLKMLTKM